MVLTSTSHCSLGLHLDDENCIQVFLVFICLIAIFNTFLIVVHILYLNKRTFNDIYICQNIERGNFSYFTQNLATLCAILCAHLIGQLIAVWTSRHRYRLFLTASYTQAIIFRLHMTESKLVSIY